MPMAMEASGGHFALLMVSTMSPVGVTLVMRSATQMKNTKRMALARPLRMALAVTGIISLGRT